MSLAGPEIGNASQGIFVGHAEKKPLRDRLGGIVKAAATSTTHTPKTVRLKPAAPKVSFKGTTKTAPGTVKGGEITNDLLENTRFSP